MAIIDILMLVIVAGVTWFVAAEGAWAAATTFLCVLLAGIMAMNFFEPLAGFLDSTVSIMSDFSDLAALLGLFAGFVFGFRYLAEQLAPTYIDVAGWLREPGRWLFGVLTGYVTMAIILTAWHTAPFPSGFLGFRAERKNLLEAVAPDRQWLAFNQYLSEHALRRGPEHVFDGPVYQLGSSVEPYANSVWPSFPIRYATRRTQWFGRGAAPAPKPAPTPSSGSGSSGGGGNPGF
jgi:uncharacterized membrane protein YgcG